MTIGMSGVNLNLVPQNTADDVKVEEEYIQTSLTAEEYVRKYFSDVPVLVEVSRCESHFRQHDKEGDLLRGKVNSLDVGVMQINERYHSATAKKMGFDLSTIEGNTAYARFLFEKEGVQPWSSSKPCWGKTTAYAEYRTELALNK